MSAGLVGAALVTGGLGTLLVIGSAVYLEWQRGRNSSLRHSSEGADEA